jgi:hypothetical protein
MRSHTLGLLTLVALAVPAHAAVLVNFDNLPASSGGVTPGGVTPFVGQTVPTNYSPAMTFTVGNGGSLYVYAEASFWSGPPPASPPNVVCPALVADASSAVCTQPLLVSFAQASNDVAFWAGAWDDVGSQLAIEIFTANMQLVSQLLVTSPQRNNTQGIINVSALSGVSAITAIRILPPQTATGDRNGLVFDNFTLDGGIAPPPPPAIPEPSSLGLAALGCAVAWLRTRTRQ